MCDSQAGRTPQARAAWPPWAEAEGIASAASLGLCIAAEGVMELPLPWGPTPGGRSFDARCLMLTIRVRAKGTATGTRHTPCALLVQQRCALFGLVVGSFFPVQACAHLHLHLHTPRTARTGERPSSRTHRLLQPAAMRPAFGPPACC